MLAKRIFPVALLSILAASSPVAVERDTKDSAPLLTAISNDPDLSVFYSLIKSTGGSSGIPGPQFEERFNNLTDGRKYTAFAPINSVSNDTECCLAFWIADLYRLSRIYPKN